MSSKIKITGFEIEETMNKLATPELALSFDNVGFLVGDKEKEIKKILLALDASTEVVQEAIDLNVDLILTHHPIIFFPIKKVVSSTNLGNKLIKLIKNDISVFTSHTNLDLCENGTNDVLFEHLELTNKKMCCEENGGFATRIGEISSEIPFEEFAKFVKEKLQLQNISTIGNHKKLVKKIMICTGSGIQFIEKVNNTDCDVFITSDIKFHEAQQAIEKGICLIDATHFATEVIVLEHVKKYLLDQFGENLLEIIISKVDGQVFKFI